jgi:hypothetical protein
MDNSTPPVKIGDKVHYMARYESGEVVFRSYTVCGVAFINNKWYAIDSERGFNECNTEWCVIGYQGTEEI